MSREFCQVALNHINADRVECRMSGRFHMHFSHRRLLQATDRQDNVVGCWSHVQGLPQRRSSTRSTQLNSAERHQLMDSTFRYSHLNPLQDFSHSVNSSLLHSVNLILFSPPGSPHPAHVASSQSPVHSSPITASTFHSRLKPHYSSLSQILSYIVTYSFRTDFTDLNLY